MLVMGVRAKCAYYFIRLVVMARLFSSTAGLLSFNFMTILTNDKIMPLTTINQHCAMCYVNISIKP